MKKFIFGCVLMLCGIIGGTGWAIAAISLVEPGAWSSVFNLFYDKDIFIILFFYAIAVLGAVLSIKTMKEEK